MIGFDKIHMHNFMSVKDDTFEFKDGVILIEGNNQDDTSTISNGAGKSTLVEALVWVSYDRTVKNVQKDIIINRDTKKDCYVEIWGYLDDGKTYYAKRSRKPNSFYYMIGDEKFEMSSMNDTQDNFEKSVLKMNFDLFMASVVFGYKHAKLTDMKDGDRKDLLDTIMDLFQYDNALNNTKAYLKKIESNVNSYTNEINTVVSAITEAQSDIDGLQEKIKNEDDKYNNLLNDFNLKIENKNKELEKLREEFRAIENVSELIVNISSELEKYISEESVAGAGMRGAKKVLDGISEGDNGICEHCGSELVPEKLEEYVKSHRDEYDQLSIKKNKYSEKIVELREEKRRLEQIDSRRQLLKINGEKLKSEIASSEAPEREAVDKLHQWKDDLFNKIKEKESKQKELELRIDKLSEVIKCLEFWKEAFGDTGIKSFLYDDVLDYMNQVANTYTEILSDGNIRIEFSTQTELKSGALRDKFVIKAFNSQGIDEYAANSGGETRKIEFGAMLSFGSFAEYKTGQSSDTLVLDEVCDALDDAGIERIAKLLKRLGKKRILIITHSSGLRGLFSKIVVATKKDGETKYLEVLG